MQACHQGPGIESIGSIRGDADLVAGLRRPVRAGWALWFTALPSIALYTLPVAVAMALVLVAADSTLADWSAAAPYAAGFALGAMLTFWGCLGFGIALVGVLLSRVYLGAGIANPYLWTLRRLAAWLTVWGIILFGCTIAMMLCIALGLDVGVKFFWIPGLVVALKLFWADEFALMHSRSPLAAIRASWSLSGRNHSGFFRFQLLAGFSQYAVLVPAIFILLLVSPALDLFRLGGAGIRSLIQFTVLFALVFLVYGSFRAPETVYFYGVRARAKRATHRSVP